MPKRPKSLKKSVSIKQTSHVEVSGVESTVRQSRTVTINGATILDETTERSTKKPDKKGAKASSSAA